MTDETEPGADEFDPGSTTTDTVLAVLQELVKVRRQRRRMAERAGEHQETVLSYYDGELLARLDLARERERRSQHPSPGDP